jgi:hypothetical protein
MRAGTRDVREEDSLVVLGVLASIASSVSSETVVARDTDASWDVM